MVEVWWLTVVDSRRMVVNRFDIIKGEIMKYVCKECGSKDIEQLEWRKVNTGRFSGMYDYDKDVQWCCNCEEHIEFKEINEKEI